MTTQMSHTSYEPSSVALSSPLQPLLQMWRLRLEGYENIAKIMWELDLFYKILKS